jgi:hypothetical protein
VAKSPLTFPAPKYGPTADYGDCEAESCELTARATCPSCGEHLCLKHAAAHETDHALTSKRDGPHDDRGAGGA